MIYIKFKEILSMYVSIIFKSTIFSEVIKSNHIVDNFFLLPIERLNKFEKNQINIGFTIYLAFLLKN